MIKVNIKGIIVVAIVIYLTDAKIFEKCELAKELRDLSIPFDQIGTFVCIADRQSQLNTSAVVGKSYYGIYQLGSEFWCDEESAGNACNVQCSDLIDDDITDDLKCVQIIFDEQGFDAWPSSKFCQSQGNSFVQECITEDNQIIQPIKEVTQLTKTSGNVGEGKVYERCELARELFNQHNVPMAQIATWVCIAEYESAYNTSAIGQLNLDGSENHGLFQISETYWCGKSESGKACSMQCSEARDNNITDDVKCIQKIYDEHQRLSGDGFNAWSVYFPSCKGTSAQYAEGCFDGSESESLPFKPIPGIQQPEKPNMEPENKFYQNAADVGKVYERCELAQELRFKHNVPVEQVATWVCIANHESSYNTSAIGRLNENGSGDHGIFQISDIYWCSPPGDGKGCGLPCSKFEDSDISDDVECILKIHEEHTGLSGDGFNAWTVYKSNCKDQSTSNIEDCFDQKNLSPRPAITQPPSVGTTRTSKDVIVPTTQTIPSTIMTTEGSVPPAIHNEINILIIILAPPSNNPPVSTKTLSDIIFSATNPKPMETTTTTTTKPEVHVTATAPTTLPSVEMTTSKSVAKSSTTVKPFNPFHSFFNSIRKRFKAGFKPKQKSGEYHH